MIDVRMPEVDGVRATAHIIDTFVEAAPEVLVLTTFDLDESAAEAIEAGASAFVLKSAEPEFLLAAIRTVAAGNSVVAAGTTRALFERFRSARRVEPGPEYSTLTQRERELPPCRARPIERRDRRTRGALRSHRQDPHLPDPDHWPYETASNSSSMPTNADSYEAPAVAPG